MSNIKPVLQVMQTEMAKLQAENQKLKDENESIKMFLESLTPGGSEYHNDPVRCFSVIKEIMQSEAVALKNVVVGLKKEKDELQKAVDRLITTCDLQASQLQMERRTNRTRITFIPEMESAENDEQEREERNNM